MKFGVRLRQTSDSNSSSSGFNGNCIFSTIGSFNAGQPEQLSFTTGVPLTHVSHSTPAGTCKTIGACAPTSPSAVVCGSNSKPILQTISIGSRAWRLHGELPRKNRAQDGPARGLGLFYDRFTENLVLQAERLNGITQTQFVVPSPCPASFDPSGVPPITFSFVTMACPNSTILRTTYRISPRLHAPGILQTAVTLERQVNKSATVSVSYLNSRGFDQLLTNNINTPLLGTFPANPVFPLGKPGNVYEFQSEAIFRQNQLITQVNYHFKTRISLRGYYVLNYANSDTSGPTSFPSNPFNFLRITAALPSISASVFSWAVRSICLTGFRSIHFCSRPRVRRTASRSARI